MAVAVALGVGLFILRSVWSNEPLWSAIVGSVLGMSIFVVVLWAINRGKKQRLDA